MVEPTAHTHYNPWGGPHNIAQRAHWSEPGFFAIYTHDGWYDPQDSRSGSAQLDPWFQMFKYNWQTLSWEPYETSLPGIPLTKWVNWREAYGIAPYPNIDWKRVSGEYPDWNWQYGFENLGGGRIFCIARYTVRIDNTVSPTSYWKRHTAFTSEDDGSVWTTKDGYGSPPVDLQYRTDLDPAGQVYAFQDHRYDWNNPRYIGDNSIMYHRTYYMQSDNNGVIFSGGPVWGNVEYQEIDKELTYYELAGYESKYQDTLNDTNFKTWTGQGGTAITNAWHLSRVCYLGKRGDVFLDVDVDPPVVDYKKVMLCVCFNRHVLDTKNDDPDYYYTGNIQRGTWKTTDGGKNWDYLGPILNDGASWGETTQTQQDNFVHHYHQLEYLGGGKVLGLFTVSIGEDKYAIRAFISEDEGVSWQAKGTIPFSTKIYQYYHPNPDDEAGLPRWIWPICAPESLQYIGKVKRLLPLKRYQLEEDQDFVIETIIVATIFWYSPQWDIEMGWTNRSYVISKDGGETWSDIEGDVPIRRESRLQFGIPTFLPASWLYNESSYQASLAHMGTNVMYQTWDNDGFVAVPTALLSTHNNGAIPSISRELGEKGEVYDVIGQPTGRQAENDFEEETIFIEVIPAESVI